MHVLLIGEGQLGSALRAVFEKSSPFFERTAAPEAARPRLTVWRRPEFDIAHPEIAERVAALAPDVVINAAAWTNVDAAESNPDAAYAVNALGPKYLAEGCEQCSAVLVHISTNEVFPGQPGRFYREYDPCEARSVYARSKLAGERAVMALCRRFYIVRVAWLFGPGGVNFPSKIIGAADQRGALRVVADEFGNPTYAPDAADAIARLIATDRCGVYHLINEGWCSRYEFACHVLASSGRGHIPVTPISHKEWQRPAQPPLHAVLVNQAAAALGIRLRPWQEAVEVYCRHAFMLAE
ncbi:MAG: dTDP-4-dehydrorhamnose reductase [Caldilinea sp.]|nr:dTDP-4-dehydrorhamnose reductase [Caldilinea sp.]MDW8441861.1 dTDP-4-dehydrorhamnose reductase [Caldilineaceae bacterium]